MGVEIERKFLVCVPPARLMGARASEIEQGYVAIEADGAEVRLRRRDSEFTLTVKRGGGLVRAQLEVALAREQFEALWPATEGRRLRKARYELALDNGLLAEFDVYAGALEGLVICEVEFADERSARAFAPPDWMGVEVTGDPRYDNRQLALRTRPPEREVR